MLILKHSANQNSERFMMKKTHRHRRTGRAVFANETVIANTIMLNALSATILRTLQFYNAFLSAIRYKQKHKKRTLIALLADIGEVLPVSRLVARPPLIRTANTFATLVTVAVHTVLAIFRFRFGRRQRQRRRLLQSLFVTKSNIAM